LNDILKQRLVGALVIIALAVVFWPVIFVDTERATLDRTRQVPPMPALEKARVAAPQALTNVEPARDSAVIELHEEPPGTREALPVTSPSAPASEKPGPQLDQSGIPVAWVLQVVTVSKKSKAEELTQQLIKTGYKAYHRPLKRGKETLHRVYVGPEFERQKLTAVKQSIDSKLKVNAIIDRYEP